MLGDYAETTSLIETFDPNSYLTTFGSNVLCVNSEKKIKFNLWAKRAEVLKEDPDYENFLFKNGNIIIFVYDVTKKESYNSIDILV